MVSVIVGVMASVIAGVMASFIVGLKPALLLVYYCNFAHTLIFLLKKLTTSQT